jgi:hypothetical protein
MSLRSTFRRKLRKILFKGLEEEEELQIIYDNMTTLKRERERERERAILRAPVRTRGRRCVSSFARTCDVVVIAPVV